MTASIQRENGGDSDVNIDQFTHCIYGFLVLYFKFKEFNLICIAYKA
jgi:hypothetical protein